MNFGDVGFKHQLDSIPKNYKFTSGVTAPVVYSLFHPFITEVGDQELTEEDFIPVNEAKSVENPVISAIKGFFNNPNKGTLDGNIGETHQQATGDCWLLSGVNSMSYTEEGREILKNAIEPCDGGVIVHLKGANDYFISEKAANQASVSPYYSSGDLDMIYLELAVESARNDAATGNTYTPVDAPYFVPNENKIASEPKKSSINGGLHSEIIYLITGKESEGCGSPEDIEAALDKTEKNKRKNIAASLDLYEPKNVKDYDGNDITLAGHHAYALKSVDGDCVTITNPWNSGEDIKLKRDVFTNEVCDLFRYTDLSDDNEPKKYITSLTKESYTDEYGSLIEEGKDTNGNILLTQEYDKEGRKTSIKKYDEKGNQVEEKSFSYVVDGSLRIKTDSLFGENGNIKSKNVIISDSEGNTESSTDKYFDEDGNLTQRIHDTYENNELTENSNTKYGKDEAVAEETITKFSGGKINLSTTNYFDDDSNINKTVKKGYKDGNIYNKTTTNFENGGNKSSETNEFFDENGNLKSTRTVYYNKDGSKDYSETTLYNKDGDIILENKTDY